MNKKKLVGITGGIGAGKSTICRIIHAMGYPVFYSDNEARKILNSDSSVIERIKGIFGEEAYRNGELDRAYIAKRVFSDQALLNQINAIVHPVVGQAFKDWAQEQKTTVVFNEAAILFETGSYKNYDHTVLVTSPVELRIERVVARDGVSPEAVQQRMDKQWSDDQKLELADFVIRNNREELIIPQVLSLINEISCP